MARQLILTPDENAQIQHSFQDHSSRWPFDALLRRHGFHIASRHGEDEPLWERRGKTYTQKKALASLPAQEVYDVAYQAKLQGEGFA